MANYAKHGQYHILDVPRFFGIDNTNDSPSCVSHTHRYSLSFSVSGEISSKHFTSYFVRFVSIFTRNFPLFQIAIDSEHVIETLFFFFVMPLRIKMNWLNK